MKVKLKDLTKEQYDKWKLEICSNIECSECPFKMVECNENDIDDCWFNNKDMYSDKFLDQEIEIEDEPLLTNEEKTYLENIIKPFKDEVGYVIKKIDNLTEYEYIIISIKHDANILLPSFRKDKYYKNLEIDKKYTLEELELFEERKMYE